VTSVTPTNNATVGGRATIRVSFSGALSPSTPTPSLSPAVAGSWQRGLDNMTFTPSGGYVPTTTETLTIPGGSAGILSASGVTLAKGVVEHFQIAQGSTLRLQQLMSILDYSPLTWTPSGTPIPATDAAAQSAAAFSPPAGSFAWRSTGWPTNLRALWQPGSYNNLTKGLVMAFEADHGLSVDGIAGPQVWATLAHAVATGEANTGGYNFALVSESNPETLTIWHNGQQVLHSLANTGVPGAPTALGTFNVYERLPYQIMRGTNLDGSHYADPVRYVAYFNGGDAIHWFPRYSFGYPQSLGCVELPIQAAAQAYPYTSYGTIVQVVS
jgi:peptidoglycan hydrolase-like protein with peptidoglycan-binding domain